jgi:primosomal protein N' (replication factor Y)
MHPGQPLAIALRGAEAPKPKPLRLLAARNTPARMTPARQRVLDAAAGPLPPADLAARRKVSRRRPQGPARRGRCWPRRFHLEPIDYPEPDLTLPHPPLNPSQRPPPRRSNRT